MRKRVKLQTHDGSINAIVFDKFEDGFYIFHLESEFKYLRIIGGVENVKAIDPVGGPMLNIEDTKIIPGFVLKKITIPKCESPKLYFKSIRNAKHRT